MSKTAYRKEQYYAEQKKATGSNLLPVAFFSEWPKFFLRIYYFVFAVSYSAKTDNALMSKKYAHRTMVNRSSFLRFFIILLIVLYDLPLFFCFQIQFSQPFFW